MRREIGVLTIVLERNAHFIDGNREGLLRLKYKPERISVGAIKRKNREWDFLPPSLSKIAIARDLL